MMWINFTSFLYVQWIIISLFSDRTSVDIKENGIRGRGHRNSISILVLQSKDDSKMSRVVQQEVCVEDGVGRRVCVASVIISRARRKKRALLEEASCGGDSRGNCQINIDSYRQKKGPGWVSARGSGLYHVLLILCMESPEPILSSSEDPPIDQTNYYWWLEEWVMRWWGWGGPGSCQFSHHVLGWDL